MSSELGGPQVLEGMRAVGAVAGGAVASALLANEPKEREGGCLI